jgi:hypothetical protein
LIWKATDVDIYLISGSIVKDQDRAGSPRHHFLNFWRNQGQRTRRNATIALERSHFLWMLDGH